MDKLRAKVQNGRLIVDEPTELPEGMVLDLIVDDEGDDLTDEEREALDAHLEESLRAARRGEIIPAKVVLDRLRAR
jgi:hypothetical protein